MTRFESAVPRVKKLSEFVTINPFFEIFSCSEIGIDLHLRLTDQTYACNWILIFIELNLPLKAKREIMRRIWFGMVSKSDILSILTLFKNIFLVKSKNDANCSSSENLKFLQINEKVNKQV